MTTPSAQSLQTIRSWGTDRKGRLASFSSLLSQTMIALTDRILQREVIRKGSKDGVTLDEIKSCLTTDYAALADHTWLALYQSYSRALDEAELEKTSVERDIRRERAWYKRKSNRVRELEMKLQMAEAQVSAIQEQAEQSLDLIDKSINEYLLEGQTEQSPAQTQGTVSDEQPPSLFHVHENHNPSQ